MVSAKSLITKSLPALIVFATLTTSCTRNREYIGIGEWQLGKTTRSQAGMGYTPQAGLVWCGNDLEAEDYLALISLDYRPQLLRDGETEAYPRRHQGQKQQRLHSSAGNLRPVLPWYYFLDNLGLDYGLSLIDYSPRLVPQAKDELLDDWYPEIVQEVDKVLAWLDTGKIMLTGEEDEVGTWVSSITAQLTKRIRPRTSASRSRPPN